MERISMADPLHVSFDLDGTLINSLPLMKSSWERVSNKYGLRIGWTSYRKYIGLPFDEICRNLGIEHIAHEVRNEYFGFNLNNVDMIEPMPGLIELADWLACSDIEWSVITSKPSLTTLPIMERFKLKPNYVVCSDSCKRGKPSVEPALHLSAMIGGPRHFVYVGDTLIDHIFAVNSGFEFVKYTPLLDEDFSLSSVGNGKVLNPHAQVSELQELKKILQRWIVPAKAQTS